MKILSLIAALWFASCAAGRRQPASASPPGDTVKTESSQPAESYILFVILKISADTLTGERRLTPVSSTSSPGRLKRRSAAPPPANRLACILYGGGRAIDTATVEHPLFRSLEYAGEDGRIALKEVTLTEEEFAVRFQATGRADSVKVTETLQGSATRELGMVKLN